MKIRDSFILKVCLQIVVVVILILGICGYIVYRNRAVIADRLLDYTIQGMTGVVTAVFNTWLDRIKPHFPNGIKLKFFMKDKKISCLIATYFVFSIVILVCGSYLVVRLFIF